MNDSQPQKPALLANWFFRQAGLTVATTVVAAAVGMSGVAGAETVFFYDDFETQADPLIAPPTGVSWSDVGLGNGYDLVASPTAGGVSALRVNRDGATDTGALLAVGNAGALVAGRQVEYSFRINSVLNPDNGVSHNFNGNVQISIMASDSSTLASFGTINGGSENYHASDAGGANVDLGVTMPRNTPAFDTVRVLLTLTEPGVDQIGGTYEIFIDVDDTDGVATNSLGVYNLNTISVPVAQPTNPAFRIARGPSTSNVIFDDISIYIPEPGSAALLLVGSLACVFRKRGRSS